MRGLSVITRESLREIFVGDWDGRPAAELRRDFSEDFNKNRFYYTFKYPNGESFADAAERFYSEILKIAREYDGKTVLVVSHSAVIRAFWYKVCGFSEGNMAEKFDFMTNASYATMTFDGEVLIPEHYFYDAHIPPTDVKPI
jgi:broad specificity phosphatase PhoE